MTVSSRTRVYRICWVLALMFSAVAAGAAILMGAGLPGAAADLPGYTPMEGKPFTWVAGFSGLPSIAAAGICAVYGIVVLSLLSFRYSRTISMELFFFAFWALSLAAESLRMESLRAAVFGGSFPQVNLVTRSILTARLLGVFSIFSGSLYAVGLNAEKPGTPIAFVLLSALVLGTGLPINTGIYGPDLIQRPGYGELLTFLSLACFLGAGANYLLAVRVTGEKGYRITALGCAMAFLGGLLLRRSVSMAAVLTGTVLLAVGTALFLSRIHAYYLWQ